MIADGMMVGMKNNRLVVPGGVKILGIGTLK